MPKFGVDLFIISCITFNVSLELIYIDLVIEYCKLLTYVTLIGDLYMSKQLKLSS